MKESLRSRLLKYLARNHTTWVPKGVLCDLARQNTGATGEHTGRRLRELHEDGQLEVKYINNHAHYRIKEGIAPQTPSKKEHIIGIGHLKDYRTLVAEGIISE